MKLFWRFIRTDIKKSKRNFALFGYTIFLGVIAIVISLLLTRTGKLLYADTLLSDYGNYDVAFCQVNDTLKDVIEKDNRFSELGYVFDQGKYRFLETGNSIEVGAVKDQKTEDMYYVNPVKGRYPNKKGEICIDRITLKSNGLAEKLGQKIQLTCDDTSEKNSLPSTKIFFTSLPCISNLPSASISPPGSCFTNSSSIEPSGVR